MQFPAWDCQPYDRVSPHGGILAQRLTTLARLSRLQGSDKPLIVLTTVNAIVQRVPAREVVAAQALSVAPGHRRADGLHRRPGSSTMATTAPRPCASPANMPCAAAFSICFRRVSTSRCGSTSSATRWNRSAPSTRKPQRTLLDMRALDLVPVSEFQLVTETIRRFRMGYVARSARRSATIMLYEAVSEGRRHPGMEHWLPLFQERMDTLFDYLDGSAGRDRAAGRGCCRASASPRSTTITRRGARRWTPGRWRDLQAAAAGPALSDRSGVDQTARRRFALARLTPFAVPTVSRRRRRRRAAGPRLRAGARRQHGQRVRARGGAYQRRCRPQRKKVVVALWSEGSRDRMAQHAARTTSCSTPPASTPGARCRRRRATRPCWRWSAWSAVSRPTNIALITEQDILGDRLVRPRKASRKLDNFISEVTSLATGDHRRSCRARHRALCRLADARRSAARRMTASNCTMPPKPSCFCRSRTSNCCRATAPTTTNVELDRLGGGGWQARKAKLKNRIREIAGELIKIAAERHLHEAPKMPVQPGTSTTSSARASPMRRPRTSWAPSTPR